MCSVLVSVSAEEKQMKQGRWIRHTRMESAVGIVARVPAEGFAEKVTSEC